MRLCSNTFPFWNKTNYIFSQSIFSKKSEPHQWNLAWLSSCSPKNFSSKFQIIDRKSDPLHLIRFLPMKYMMPSGSLLLVLLTFTGICGLNKCWWTFDDGLGNSFRKRAIISSLPYTSFPFLTLWFSSGSF